MSCPDASLMPMQNCWHGFATGCIIDKAIFPKQMLRACQSLVVVSDLAREFPELLC